MDGGVANRRVDKRAVLERPYERPIAVISSDLESNVTAWDPAADGW